MDKRQYDGDSRMSAQPQEYSSNRLYPNSLVDPNGPCAERTPFCFRYNQSIKRKKKRRIMNNGTLEQGREGSLERESLEILHDGEQLAGGRHEKG